MFVHVFHFTFVFVARSGILRVKALMNACMIPYFAEQMKWNKEFVSYDHDGLLGAHISGAT